LNIRCGDGDAAQWINAMTFDPEAIAHAVKFVKGARIYLEGTLRLDAWTGADGGQRHGLSAMSWHTRLAAIGRNRPPKKDRVSVAAGTAGDDRQRRGVADRDLDDPIPF
jgi:single-stranded DNA-binding protein